MHDKYRNALEIIKEKARSHTVSENAIGNAADPGFGGIYEVARRVLEDEDRDLHGNEFRHLLDLYMVSDPWPLKDGNSHEVVGNLLNRVAKNYGCKDWVEAYHSFGKNCISEEEGF